MIFLMTLYREIIKVALTQVCICWFVCMLLLDRILERILYSKVFLNSIL